MSPSDISSRASGSVSEVLGDASSARAILQAHDKAAQEAATAAAFMRLGETVSEAVHDAEIVFNAPGAVDSDCALVSQGSGLLARQQASEGGAEATLGTAPLVAPSLECVKDALEAGLAETHRPSMPLYPDKDGAASVRDSIVSCVGSMARPESYTAEDEEDQEIDSTHHTTHTTDHAHRSNDAPAPATDAALLSLAAHVLGLSDDKAAGEQVASAPALAVGGTGLGAHSGGFAAGVHTRASPPLPQSPHPSVASQDSSLPRMPSGGLARSNSTPGRAGSSTPGRSRPPPVRTTPPLPTGGPSGAGRGGVAGGGTDVSGEYSGGSAPSSVSGYPVTPSGSGVAKRPPTPPPGRLNTSLSNRARSSASSHRSGTSSPLHSARMSHTSLDELWAVEETDERANSLVDLNGGSDVMGVLSERDSEGDTDNNSPTVPAWFTPSSPQPAGSVTITQDEISNLTTRGSSLTSASPRRTESLREDAMSRGDAGVAGAMVGGMAGGSSQGSTAPATPAAREAECVGHTGIPLLDEEPGLVREVQDMREQIALHGYVNRAAALAGALVHAGHHSIAQASNLAEGAMDTAGVVDFVDAVTNFDNPDTVPDMLARHGSSSSAPPAKEDPATPHASPATLSRQTSRANPDITTPNTTPTNSATAGPSAAAMQREIARSVDAWCEASASPKKGGVGVGGGGGKVAGDTRQASAFAAGAAPAGVADARGDTPPLGAMAALCKELSGALLTGQPSGTPECPDLTEDTPATEFYGYQAHGAHLCEDVLEHTPAVLTTPTTTPATTQPLSPHGQEVARALPQRLDSDLGGVTPAPSTAAALLACGSRAVSK